MEIKEQSTGRLTIETDLWTGVNVFLGSVVQYILLAVVLIVAATRESKWMGILVFFAALFGMWIVSLLYGKEAAFRCILDKERQIATITFRAPWFLWMPQRERFPLNRITAVIFSKNEKDEPKVSFARQSDDPILFSGEATAKAVERISRFLRIPLQIELGDERITYIPWSANETACLIPTPCTSCGAPLPKIEAGMKNIKCGHCGMNMVIQWQEDKFSYRQEKGLDL